MLFAGDDFHIDNDTLAIVDRRVLLVAGAQGLTGRCGHRGFRIVGWRVSRSRQTQFVLDALEQALHERRPAHDAELVAHSDRGSQYLALRYTERLADAGIEPSVGSVGDSYDNALAETIIGLFKAEVIHRRPSWRTADAVEWETLKWVDWFNHRRLLGPIGHIPPAEAERAFHETASSLNMAA